MDEMGRVCTEDGLVEVGLVGCKRDILDTPHCSSSPRSFEVEPAIITEDPLSGHPPDIESVAEMGERIRSSVAIQRGVRRVSGGPHGDRRSRREQDRIGYR